MLIFGSSLCVSAGGSETSSSRSYRPGFETDKQLVHQPEKAPLEAIRGYAIRRDGCSASRPLLHGQYYVQSILHGLLIYTPLIIIDNSFY